MIITCFLTKSPDESVQAIEEEDIYFNKFIFLVRCEIVLEEKYKILSIFFFVDYYILNELAYICSITEEKRNDLIYS